MAMGEYNGWAGEIRDIRGKKLSRHTAEGRVTRNHVCEITGVTHGLTFHAEEYGSTYEDMITTTHELCPYVHGMLHVRFQFPNRFKRFKQRVMNKDFREAERHKTLFSFFGRCRGIGDLPHMDDCDTGIPWLDAVALTKYVGPPKIALKLTTAGHAIPDPAIYTSLKANWPTSGVIYDSATGTLQPYVTAL